MTQELIKSKWLFYASIVLSIGAYFFISFYLDRSSYLLLIALFVALSFSYLYLLKEDLSLKTIFILGLLFRVLFLFSLPQLSDDYFRFFWDGSLTASGYNPFALLPSEVVANEGFDNFILKSDNEIFSKLNSPNYYTIYPPICQFIFAATAWLANGNVYIAVILIKLLSLVFEISTFFGIYQLLQQFKLKEINAAIYWLNPLVIVELIGNIHFEVFMIGFLVWSIYKFINDEYWWSSLLLACAINSKMLPLMLLPFLSLVIPLRHSIKYIITIIVLSCLLWGYFLDADVLNAMGSSIGLYFKSFEFNASIYYLVREVGQWIYGYNIIASSGWVMGVIAMVMIVIMAFLFSSGKRNIIIFGLLAYSIQLFFATTIHPWYIINLIFFSVFINTKYPIVWSLLVPVTYVAYAQEVYKENLWLVCMEYLMVFSVLVFFDFRKILNKMDLKQSFETILKNLMLKKSNSK